MVLAQLGKKISIKTILGNFLQSYTKYLQLNCMEIKTVFYCFYIKILLTGLSRLMHVEKMLVKNVDL